MSNQNTRLAVLSLLFLLCATFVSAPFPLEQTFRKN